MTIHKTNYIEDDNVAKPEYQHNYLPSPQKSNVAGYLARIQLLYGEPEPEPNPYTYSQHIQVNERIGLIGEADRLGDS